MCRDCRQVCGEVIARRAAQPGSGSIALYRRLRLGQWWSVEWRPRCIQPNIPSSCKIPRPEIHTEEHGRNMSSKQPPACRLTLGECRGSPE